MEFLRNLEQLMASYNMNRNDLAKACGISYSAVSSWWNRGYENVSMQTLIKLSKCFNCSLEELVHGVKRIYSLPEYGEAEYGLVYTTKEFTQNELKLISLYANYLKTLREKEVTDDDN